MVGPLVDEDGGDVFVLLRPVAEDVEVLARQLKEVADLEFIIELLVLKLLSLLLNFF